MYKYIVPLLALIALVCIAVGCLLLRDGELSLGWRLSGIPFALMGIFPLYWSIHLPALARERRTSNQS